MEVKNNFTGPNNDNERNEALTILRRSIEKRNQHIGGGSPTENIKVIKNPNNTNNIKKPTMHNSSQNVYNQPRRRPRGNA